MTVNSNQRYWEDAARQVRRRMNFGWWLDSLTGPLFFMGLIAATILLLYRQDHQASLSISLLIASVTGLLVCASLIAWLNARKKFITRKEALVQLDAHMRLFTSLTSANAGVIPWPAPIQPLYFGTSWNWRRISFPPIGVIALLLTAIFLPLAIAENNDQPAPEPAALSDLESSLEKLAHDDSVEKDYLDEMEKRIEELREQNSEDWFSHSSLEATDNLKQAHENEVAELTQNLKQAERALQALQKHGGQMNQQTRERLLNQFDQALGEMKQRQIKPNRELLEKLKQLNPEQLKGLDQNQLDQLRENMRKNAQNLKDALGDQAGDEWQDELNQEGGPGDQGNQGNGNKPGSDFGNGGISRGPGDAPGVLGKKSEELNDGKFEGIESKDLSNSLPGDILETQDTEHEVDRLKIGPRAGGSAAQPGQGGDRIWKESLLPDEQRAMKEFFK